MGRNAGADPAENRRSTDSILLPPHTRWRSVQSQAEVHPCTLAAFRRHRLVVCRRRRRSDPFLLRVRPSGLYTSVRRLARHLADPFERGDALAGDGLDMELYPGSSSAERHAYRWRRAVRRGAVSALKARGLKPRRRLAEYWHTWAGGWSTKMPWLPEKCGDRPESEMSGAAELRGNIR